MKLSEAIRLNGMMKPQGWGPASMISPDAPCALGGALQSIGIQPRTAHEAYRAIGTNWQFVCEPAKCPCGVNHAEETLGHISRIERILFGPDVREPISSTILSAIIFLNDHHRWTRSQIADWVATVEPAEEVEAEEVKQEVWRFVRK